MRRSLASSHLCSLDWDTPRVTRFVVIFWWPRDNRAGNEQLADALRKKVLQRIYKYGGQPFVRDYLAKHHGTDFDNAFGKGTGKAIMHATAGR